MTTQGMEKTLETARVFFQMGCAGLVIGMLFDIFRAFHISFKKAGDKFDFISVQITDIIFAVISFCIFTLGLYIFNGGEIRSYCFLGAAAGITVYFLVLAPVIGRIMKFVFGCVFAVINFICIFFTKAVKKVFTKH